MNFFINRTDAIGDTILTLPMAELIKRKYSDAKVTFLVSRRCSDYLVGNPYIDEILLYDHSLSFFRRLKFLWKVLSRNNADFYFYVGGIHLPSFVAWLKRIPFRAGVLSKFSEFIFLNHGKRQKRSQVEMHEAMYNLDLLKIRPLDFDFDESIMTSLQAKIFLRDDERASALKLFRQELVANGLSADKEFVFVHPGMSGHTLNWDGYSYAKMIKLLDARNPGKYNFIISFTPSDERYLISLRSFLNDPANQSLKGNTYFFDGSVKGARNYLNVLSHASLFVGPSTGTLHMANALGVRSIGIFSPIRVQSPQRWSPFNKAPGRITILSPQVVCEERFKCDINGCQHAQCMKLINIESAAMEAEKLMNNGN